MAKALVTGGAGFIGSHLVDYLIDNLGMDVVVLDDLSGGYLDNVNQKATFIEGSIVDSKLIKELFTTHKFDYVYHLAAYAAEGLSHFIRKFNYENNLVGSVNLINESVNHGVKSFVFTSSIAVYGAGQCPLKEDATPTPEDPYGIAKYAVEMDLKASHEMFGMNFVIFRPHNVYGERQNLGDKYRNVLGIFMNKIMQGEDLVIFGDGEQVRAFTYVQDIIPGIAKSALLPAAQNRVFNVGTDDHHTVNALAKMVLKTMDGKVDIKHVEARNEVKVAYSDHQNFNKVFPDIEYTSLGDGVRIMVEWAKSAGYRKSKDFGNIEVLKNLPPSWL